MLRQDARTLRLPQTERRKLADNLGVPFVSDETTQRMDMFEDPDNCMVPGSRVADEGLSPFMFRVAVSSTRMRFELIVRLNPFFAAEHTNESIGHQSPSTVTIEFVAAARDERAAVIGVEVAERIGYSFPEVIRYPLRSPTTSKLVRQPFLVKWTASQ